MRNENKTCESLLDQIKENFVGTPMMKQSSEDVTATKKKSGSDAAALYKIASEQLSNAAETIKTYQSVLVKVAAEAKRIDAENKELHEVMRKQAREEEADSIIDDMIDKGLLTKCDEDICEKKAELLQMQDDAFNSFKSTIEGIDKKACELYQPEDLQFLFANGTMEEENSSEDDFSDTRTMYRHMRD